MKRKLITLLQKAQADLLSLGFLLLLPAIFFWRETLGRRTLGDQDAVFWFFPAYHFVAGQLLSARLPLWNPDYYSGVPLFAQWQAGVLDPLNWIHLWGLSSRTLTLTLQLSFSLSMLAMWSYARTLGLSRRAGIIAAIIYSLSGFAVARTLYPGFLHIYALAPLVLTLTTRIIAEGRWRDVVFGALVVAWQVAAAHPQPLIYSSLLASALAVFLLTTGQDWSLLRTWRRVGRSLLQFAAMFLLGGGLMAVQLLPAAEIAARSVRRDWPYEMFTLHSIHPASLLTVLIPFFHGGGRGEGRMAYWGISWHHNESQIYLGALAVALAAGGALLAIKRRHFSGIFWTGAGVVGLLLVLGRYFDPLARILYHLPVLNQFRSPNRHWLEVALAVAVLAGYGADRLLAEPPALHSILTRTIRGASMLALLLVTATATLITVTPDRVETFLRSLPDWGGLPDGFLTQANLELRVPLLLAGGATILIWSWTASHRRAGWFLPVVGLLLADYYLYASTAPITHSAGLERGLGAAVVSERLSPRNAEQPWRSHIMLSPAAGEFSPYWFAGEAMVTGYDPLLDGRYKNFTGIDEAGRTWLSSILQPRDRTLDLLSTRYLYVPPDWKAMPAPPIAPLQLPPDRSLRGVAQGGNAGVLEIEAAGISGRVTISLTCGHRELLATDLPLQNGNIRLPLQLADPCADPYELTITNLSAAPVDLAGARMTGAGREVAFTHPEPVAAVPSPRWQPAGSLPPDSPYAGYRVFENTARLPRVWLVDRVEEAWEGDQLKLIRGEIRDREGQLIDLRRTALVTRQSEPQSSWYRDFLRPEAGDSAAGTARVVLLAADRLCVESSASRPMILVVGELANNGWRVMIDGYPAAWHEVDYALRGVPLPAGKHRVEFLYRPDSLLTGAAISLLTALIIALTGPGVWLRRRFRSGGA